MGKKKELDKNEVERVLKENLDIVSSAEELGVSTSFLRIFCQDNYSKSPLEVQKDLLRFGKELKNLCLMQCTCEEIRCFFGMDGRALDRKCQKEFGKDFKEVFNEYKALGRISLRRQIFKHGEKSPAVSIFLNKNYNGMSDRPEQAQTIFDENSLTNDDE